MKSAAEIKRELQKYASDADAVHLQRFFKTGPGEYGEGDQFIGVRLPRIRQICKRYKDAPLREIKKLIESPIHEHRMTGLIVLTLQYPKGDTQAIHALYMDQLDAGNINNWDLVDTTCENIVGLHLIHQPEKLTKLAYSDNLWKKRTSMIAMFAYIKRGDYTTTFDIAEILLHDKHDLIQKAVGWLLREVGKRIDESLLLNFLDRHAHEMPRTQLRYAIEKLNPKQKRHYMELKNQ